MTARWTSGDVPGQQGRLAVVTGANTGLGLETARVLAARGASVVLAVRDTDKGKAAAARIAGSAPGANVTVQPLDLASLESVRAAAGELRARHPRIACWSTRPGGGTAERWPARPVPSPAPCPGAAANATASGGIPAVRVRSRGRPRGP